MQEIMGEMFQGMEYVYEVYQEKSFSKAAKNLFISQPSLSANVKRVEKRVGYPLFDRSVTPICLTEYGQRYIQAVKAIMSVENSFYNYMTDIGGLKTGSLKLGGSSLFSSYVLPQIISSFTAMYPKIKIELVEESTANLKEMLGAGILDLVIDNARFEESVFGKKAYREEYLVLAVPKAFPVNKALTAYQIGAEEIKEGSLHADEKKNVPLEVFAGQPFLLLKPENDTRKRAARLCREHGFLPKVVLELDQQATAYNVTCSGMGISFISDTLICQVPPHPDVVYYKLSGEGVKRTLYFYWKRGKYMSRAMEEFLKTAGQKDSNMDGFRKP